MKEIRIVQKYNKKDIILHDEDDSDLLEYTKSLQGILKSKKVLIVETSLSAAILRPTEISAILVEEPSIYEMSSKKKEDKKEPENIDEDIISD